MKARQILKKRGGLGHAIRNCRSGIDRCRGFAVDRPTSLSTDFPPSSDFSRRARTTAKPSTSCIWKSEDNLDVIYEIRE